AAHAERLAERLSQDLARDGAGGDPHRGLARRGAPAAAIIAHAVFLPVGVIGVAGAEEILDLAVVLRALVDIVDDERDRRTRRFALEYAGKNAHRVRFLALRHVFATAGSALVEPGLDVGLG